MKTANRERILPLRIEGKMICKLGQVAATQQDHDFHEVETIKTIPNFLPTNASYI